MHHFTLSNKILSLVAYNFEIQTFHNHFLKGWTFLDGISLMWIGRGFESRSAHSVWDTCLNQSSCISKLIYKMKHVGFIRIPLTNVFFWTLNLFHLKFIKDLGGNYNHYVSCKKKRSYHFHCVIFSVFLLFWFLGGDRQDSCAHFLFLFFLGWLKKFRIGVNWRFGVRAELNFWHLKKIRDSGRVYRKIKNRKDFKPFNLSYFFHQILLYASVNENKEKFKWSNKRNINKSTNLRKLLLISRNIKSKPKIFF